MTLLNSKIPIINTYDINNPSITWSQDYTAGISELMNTNFNFDFWYCLFSCEKSFKVYDLTQLIDQDSVNKIKNKQAFLVLDNTLEPFELVIDSIYENIVSKGIPATQIILLTNLYDAKSYCKKIAEQFNQPMLRIFWYTVFEQGLQNDLIHNVYTINNNDKSPQTLEIKKYHKKFLNFNRRWRLHRPFLVALLHSKKLLDYGYVSLGPCEAKDNWDYRWNELISYFQNDQSILNLLQSCEDVKELPPLFLDTEELHINRAVSTVDTNQYYENSYFSVVSETTFFTKYNYNSFRFLSEKAFKPIAMKHPFILVSVPHSLEIFKIMGYKTFSPIINESYDLELDDGKRMLMILDEIDRLSKFNKQERANFILQCQDICQYNYKMLLSKTKFITEL
jgi:hypothetical protein